MEVELGVLGLGLGHCRSGKLGPAAEVGNRAFLRLLAAPTRA